jgi:UDP-N-acetyl-2-amino-2-deoxyglucuronate dehydrogenase
MFIGLTVEGGVRVGWSFGHVDGRPVTRRIALVGLSWISADLAGDAADPTLGTAIPYSHASAIAAIPELEIVAGCDISEAARDVFRERWSKRWPDLKVYADYREMLQTERPELAAVVTPDHLHAAVVQEAVAAGVRGIFCEKPLATTLEEADAIIDAVRGAGVTMNVNYTRRWYPEFVEARRLVREGALGRLSQIVVQMGGPRSMLFRNHTHAIDLINFLADANPVWVWAELERGFEAYGTAYAGDGGNDPATEPGANYYIAYDNGVRAYLTGMKDTVGLDTSVSLTGPEARLVVDLEGIRLHSVHHEDIRTKPGVTTIQRLSPRWTVAGMQAAVLDLVTAMDEGRDPASPPEAARATVAITQAILESQARGNVKVQLSEFAPASVRADG